MAVVDVKSNELQFRMSTSARKREPGAGLSAARYRGRVMVALVSESRYDRLLCLLTGIVMSSRWRRFRPRQELVDSAKNVS